MVTFANLGSARLPCLKFVGLRVRKMAYFSACQLSIYYNSFPVIRTTILQKIVIFTYPGLHFFLFALGTSLWQSRKTLHD